MGNILFGRSEPPDHANCCNDKGHANGIIHVGRRNRSYWWEEQYHADEKDPYHSYCVYRSTPATHCVRTLDERYPMFVDAMSDNDGDITEVEGRCSDVEDGHNRLI
jgi:hypothetical protein